MSASFLAFALEHPLLMSSSLRSFLDDLYRIAHRDYEPTDDDVVRARLRTMGVQEHCLRRVCYYGLILCFLKDGFADCWSKVREQGVNGFFTT